MSGARFAIITAFPDMVRAYLGASIVGRAMSRGLIEVEIVDIRDHAEGEWRQIDDAAYGGGGMVLMAEPLQRALDATAGRDDRYVVCPTPQGVPLHQQLVEDLRRRAGEKRLTIVCGHYEGIDERFTQRNVDLEVSLGDFVMTGGELASLAIVDSVTRLVEGAVGRAESVRDDSFFSGMLDTPHYTRPAIWEGMEVPRELTGGDAAEISAFRRGQSVRRTLSRRPDILTTASAMPYMKRGVYVMLMHHPVQGRVGEMATTAITGMDVHDIARACRTYGVKRFIIATPLPAQRDIVKRIASHWTEGGGSASNPDRAEAMRLVKTFASYRRALGWIEEHERSAPFTIATTAQDHPRGESWITMKARMLEGDRPIVIMLGTGHGLHSSVMESADAVLAPIRGAHDSYDHLSVRSAASIMLDRFFGLR